MNEKEILDLTQKLIRFRTTPKNQKALYDCARFIFTYFDGFGGSRKIFLRKKIPTIVVTSKKTRSPHILLQGHFDVSEGSWKGNFQPFLRGGKLFGQGSFDMKGGLAIMMHTFREFIRENLKSDIGLMFHGDEESGGENSAQYCVNNLHYSTGLLINFDGGLGETISQAEKGILRLRLRAKVVKTHPVNVPWRGKNALDELLFAYGNFQKLFQKKIHASEDDNWHTTYSSWYMHSFSCSSHSPEEAEMKLSIHYVEDISPEKLFEKIRKALPGVKVEMLFGCDRVYIPQNEPKLQRWKTIMEEEFQKPIAMRGENGASDARFFSKFKIPMIITNVSGGGAHSPNEYLQVSSLLPLRRTLKRFLGEYSRSIQK